MCSDVDSNPIFQITFDQSLINRYKFTFLEYIVIRTAIGICSI